MNQVKIGKFISTCRKNKNLTQSQLAEKLGITDRAISKWETGKGLPDSGIMLDLCNELGISVNELLSGEMIEMRDYDKKTEELLLKLAKQDEEKNKKLMAAMWMTLTSTIIFYTGILILSSFMMDKGVIGEDVFAYITVAATILLVIIGFFAFKLEVEAGYYECEKCHHKFVPTYIEGFLAIHISTTRHLKCPKCHKRTWAKKVMSK